MVILTLTPIYLSGNKNPGSVHNLRQEWNFFLPKSNNQSWQIIEVKEPCKCNLLIIIQHADEESFEIRHNIFWITHKAWVQSLILISISIFHEINTGLKRVNWYFTIKHVSQFDLRVEFNSIVDNPELTHNSSWKVSTIQTVAPVRLIRWSRNCATSGSESIKS